MLGGGGQQLDELGHLRHARGVDVVDARADAGGELLLDVAEQLHPRTGRLDGGDVGVEVVDGLDDLTELRIAEVRVDLGVRRRVGGDQAEAAHGPVQVLLAALLA